MKCITNMYGLSSGDWTSYLRFVGVMDEAITKFNKCTYVSSLVKHGKQMISVVVKKTVPRRKPCVACENRPLHVGAHFIV